MAEAEKVLVVDDEPTVRTTLEMALSTDGLMVTQAENAESAAELMAGERFDLLITDKNLPGMSGVELIRTLRARGDDTPALLITGHASLASAMDTMSLGVHGFLQKPFTDIFDVVRRAREAIAAGKRPAGRALIQASEHFGKASAVLASASAALGRVRILIANPDPAERQWLVDQLSRDGDDLRAVATHAELRRLLPAAPPDVVVVDRADDADALTALLSAVGRQYPEAIAIVTAEGPTLNEVIALIELGVRAVLDKPLTGEALSEKVDGLLAALRASRAANERRPA